MKHDPSKRNPAFPSDLNSCEFVGKGLFLGKVDHLAINDDMVEQLENWKPLKLSTALKNPDKLPYDLYVARGSKVLSSGQSYFDNKIGDLRVFYDAVMEGPYTAVGKVVVDGNHRSLQPYKAKMKESLASSRSSYVGRVSSDSTPAAAPVCGCAGMK